ncbi:hypothetical protein NQZ68_019010 [Dissostichus eleginoides]|nr:hypothetical protein NQZ68_019010 [Dissostichus eleginoides]
MGGTRYSTLQQSHLATLQCMQGNLLSSDPLHPLNTLRLVRLREGFWCTTQLAHFQLKKRAYVIEEQLSQSGGSAGKDSRKKAAERVGKRKGEKKLQCCLGACGEGEELRCPEESDRPKNGFLIDNILTVITSRHFQGIKIWLNISHSSSSSVSLLSTEVMAQMAGCLWLDAFSNCPKSSACARERGGGGVGRPLQCLESRRGVVWMEVQPTVTTHDLLSEWSGLQHTMNSPALS